MAAALDEPATWTDAEPLECCAVVPEAPDVATVSFVSPSGAWFRYLPGQFVTLELPVPGGPIWRTYTISSSPSRPLTLGLTVKAGPNSIGTRWMLDHLKVGMRIRARGPAGIFTLPMRGKGKYLFISAGTGITPSLSMTNYLYDRGLDADVVLISCARRPAEIICRKRMELMVTRVPTIKLHFIVEQEDPYDVWTGYRGRLNQIMLGLIASDYLERQVYCCGPEPFMQAVRDMLIALGYDMANYHQESFALAVETKEDAPVLDDFVPDEAKRAEIVFADSDVTAACDETETILVAAKAAGLNIPNGCGFGVCGTCKIQKISGEVHMVHNGGISADDIEAGFILACCSTPIGRVEVAV
ncbi:MAG: hybrid-cluster NAD(P)-dependent oxidoreductase [Amaricoccus sp.]